MILPSRLGCPLSRKTPNMGNPGLEISKRNFRRIPLLVLSETVMTAFDRLARTLYECMVSNERESRALAVQRDGLVPRLVSGEVGVGEPSVPR